MKCHQATTQGQQSVREKKGDASIFRIESEMLPVVESWLLGQGFQTKIEFSMPWGICDLVGCRLQEDQLEKRLKLGQRWPVGPLTRVAVLLRLSQARSTGSLSLKKLHSDLDPLFGHAEVNTHVAELRKRRFLNTSDQNEMQSLATWLPLHERLVAIELKLNRVSDALYQAKLNREFADESYVALPFEVAQRAKLREVDYGFPELGIGLLAVASSRVEVLLPPQRAPTMISELQVHATERFFRNWFKDSST